MMKIAESVTNDPPKEIGGRKRKMMMTMTGGTE
jgi:hypothetical protein